MRARTTAKKTKVRVHHSGPADQGRPSRSAGTCGITWKETQQEAKDERHRRIENPPRSPNQGGTKILKPSGTFWIMLPRKRSDGESRLPHGCLEKYRRRKQIIHTRRSSARERISRREGRRSQTRVRRIIHVCSSLRTAFGRPADRERMDIRRHPGCRPRQGPHDQLHGLSRRMFLGPPW